jgi:hypothetical protein
MTAEIAILNKEAVALAADSAATTGIGMSPKIFSSANKLFALSKYTPIGMMVFGGAHYMSIPWETIIKEYRRKLGETRFPTLNEYANDFIEFLDKGNDFIPLKIQDDFFKSHVNSFFQTINKIINNQFDQVLVEKNDIKHEEVVQIVKETIKKIADRWNKSSPLASLPKNFADQLKKKYKDNVRAIRKEIFQKLPISNIESRRLNEIAYSLFTRSLPIGFNRKGTSGIVIAGFGDKEVFPSLYTCDIHGFINNRLIYDNQDDLIIDFKNTAIIIPFAQGEMVHTFMEGVNPDYQRLIFDSLYDVFKQYTQTILDKLKISNEGKKYKELKKILSATNKKLLGSLFDQLQEYKEKEFSGPVVDVVSVLPKDELASMAESLVNLTSLKRRVSSDLETVGGPIDVAVISKSDGFVWIRRKRYFEKQINPRFFANYLKR